jgi:Tol biopolymer transport system component
MNLPHDPQLAEWLAAGAAEGSPEPLARALAATRRTRKRPRWTFPERWLPVQLTMTRTPSLRPTSVIVLLALVTVALVTTALYVGSQRRLPEPLFRNGAVVFSSDDDLFITDQLGGTPRLLVGGPESDSNPVFSPLGDRIAFIREGPDGRDGNRLMSVNVDGSGLTALTSLEAGISSFAWSPDGTAFLVGTVDTTAFDPIDVVKSDGSGSRRLDTGVSVLQALWRPDGRQIAVSSSDDRTYIAGADGTNLRRLPGVNGASDLTWSPDGTRLGVLSSDGNDIYQVTIADIDEDGALAELRQPTAIIGAYDLLWSPDGKHLVVGDDGLGGNRISIIDIAEDGAMTDHRRLDLDAWVPDSGPVWSPDGSQLAFELRTDSALRAGIVNPDGSGFRLIGPEVFDPGSPSTEPGGGPWKTYEREIGVTWAPDGRSIVLFEHPWRLPSVPVGPDAKVWSVDVATGEQTEIDTPVGDWQRLAP